MLLKKIKLKSVMSLIISVLILITTSVVAFATPENTNGGYISIENNDEKIIAAAQTLSKYLNQITDKNFPIQNKGIGGIKFILGFTDEVADNGYIIDIDEDGIIIKGSGTRGLIHGVYAFLEKYCECDWFTKDLISIPKNENISFPLGEKTKYEPYFEYTDTDWYSGELEYSLANGLSGGVYRDIPVELGGEVSYLGGFCHTLATQYCAADKYFESNPEYFALFEGKRDPGQLCLTNEKVYEIVRDEVMELLKEQHNPDEYLQIVSLTQHDNQHMCQCENCRAIDDANGSHSGTMITFVNRIAKDIKAAGYDNIAIDTFAYQYTRKTPTNVIPEDNVIVRLCTIECCFAHPLDDPNCPENVGLMEDLVNWGKICNRIYVWDYTTNYANTMGIFPDFGVLQKNIQIFYENNVKGIYEEGNYYISQCDGEFGDLRCYLLAKLMQNPYIDSYELTMGEFNTAFYGNAASYINEFLSLTQKKPVPEGKHLMIYVGMQETLDFDSNDIKTADTLWQKAKESVKDNKTYLNRVLRSELCWRYWKLYNKTSEIKNIDKFIEDALSFGITKVSEGGGAETDENHITNLKARISSNAGKDLFNNISFVLFVICNIIAVITAGLAFKNNYRKWLYLVCTLVFIASFEIFGWHRRAFLAWKDLDEYAATLVMMVLLFALAGALAVRGKKEKIKAAILSGCAFISIHEAAVLIINNAIYNGTANKLAIGVAYMIDAVLGIIIFSVSLKNMINKKKEKNNE